MVFEKFNLRLSKETIRRHLDSLMYTLKQARNEPERANSSINKEKRTAYVRELLNYQAQNKPIVYMDEANFNLHISKFWEGS